MKFTVAALLIAGSNAVLLQDDCGGKWCNKGLPYDHDVPTLNKAEADNVAKHQAFNGATKADADAKAAAAAAAAHEAATSAADAAAGAAKTKAAADFAATPYLDGKFPAAEATHGAAVITKEVTLDAHLKAFDDKVAKDLISARKGRDLDAATAAKNASDANLKANQERVAWEKDQLVRGQNQDRLKEVNENTSAKTSEILGKHDERERANGRLLKAIASFWVTKNRENWFWLSSMQKSIKLIYYI